jgi:hypothetical protein
MGCELFFHKIEVLSFRFSRFRVGGVEVLDFGLELAGSGFPDVPLRRGGRVICEGGCRIPRAVFFGRSVVRDSETRTKTSEGSAASREASLSSCFSETLWHEGHGHHRMPVEFKCVRGGRTLGVAMAGGENTLGR